MTTLTFDVIDFSALTECVRRPGCGAVAIFLGTVRDRTGEVLTTALDYDAYAAMAEKMLAQVETEVREKLTVGDVAIVHRLGRLTVGDVSVAVAVSTPHRKDAFDACEFAIDRLKEIVPIWKTDVA